MLESQFVVTDSSIFSVAILESNWGLIRKNIIWLNWYNDFVKYEFKK